MLILFYQLLDLRVDRWRAPTHVKLSSVGH